MGDECIHGLESGRCDLCFPKPAAEGRPASRPTRNSAPPSRAADRRPASSPPKSRPGDNVGDQRIYHITHVSNLAGILTTGALLADLAGAVPVVDIASPATRETRRGVLVSGPGGLPVANHVPFFLSPNSTLWDGIRNRRADPRVSPAALAAAASEFVIVVSTVGKADERGPGIDPPTIVADGDAAGTLTRFAATPEGRQRMLRTLRADPESPRLLAAEFLVAEQFPFELISLIGVANDRARDEVKTRIADSAFSPKVAVYPPWFQRSD